MRGTAQDTCQDFKINNKILSELQNHLVLRKIQNYKKKNMVGECFEDGKT